MPKPVFGIFFQVFLLIHTLSNLSLAFDQKESYVCQLKKNFIIHTQVDKIQTNIPAKIVVRCEVHKLISFYVLPTNFQFLLLSFYFNSIGNQNSTYHAMLSLDLYLIIHEIRKFHFITCRSLKWWSAIYGGPIFRFCQIAKMSQQSTQIE